MDFHIKFSSRDVCPVCDFCVNRIRQSRWTLRQNREAVSKITSGRMKVTVLRYIRVSYE